MNTCDEIEFFGFVPLFFIREITDEMFVTLEKQLTQIKTSKSLHHKRYDKLKDIFSTSLRKNLILFEGFVTKTVFSFPKDFSFERKVTDLRCDEDLQKLCNELYQIFEEEKYLRSETMRMLSELELETARKKMYQSLLHESDQIIHCIERTAKMKDLCGDIDEIYGMFMDKKILEASMHNENVEFKDMRKELLKSEREQLFDVVDIDFLNETIKNIK